MDDRAIWRAEQYERKAKGIVKPTGCQNYYKFPARMPLISIRG